MPEGLAEMIADNPKMFAADVIIEAPEHADVSDVAARLGSEGVRWTVRRVGTGGIRLITDGLRYSGTHALADLLHDRD